MPKIGFAHVSESFSPEAGKPVLLDMSNYTSGEVPALRRAASRKKVTRAPQLSLQENRILHCNLQQKPAAIVANCKNIDLTAHSNPGFMALATERAGHAGVASQ
jgi:hypothetical protein